MTYFQENIILGSNILKLIARELLSQLNAENWTSLTLYSSVFGYPGAIQFSEIENWGLDAKKMTE